jgi:hypothetical protein
MNGTARFQRAEDWAEPHEDIVSSLLLPHEVHKDSGMIA